MKKVLKGWLIDNSVTTDNKTDKILLLASAGSLTLDDVLEETEAQSAGTVTRSARQRDAEQALDAIRRKYGKGAASLGL